VIKPSLMSLFVVVGTRTINLMPKVNSILQRFLPFHDESSAPPASASPSLLTAQLELFGNTHHSLSVEILPPKSKSVVQIQIALPEQPALSETLPSKQDRAAPSPYPTTKQKRQRSKARVRSHDRADSESPSRDSSSSLDSPSDSESTSTTLSGQPKIPKPPGEPGRPGRGGYNLECAIDWNNKVYTKFRSFTHQLINEHLDTTKCASAQNPASLKVVRDKAMGAFPDLDYYADCWPVTDLIMMRLKYTSRRARLRELEVAAGKARRFPASSK